MNNLLESLERAQRFSDQELLQYHRAIENKKDRSWLIVGLTMAEFWACSVLIDRDMVSLDSGLIVGGLGYAMTLALSYKYLVQNSLEQSPYIYESERRGLTRYRAVQTRIIDRMIGLVSAKLNL